MSRSTDLLRSYVQALQRLMGATAVSLFVPASSWRSERGSDAILIHEGDRPVPELADLETAEAFHQARAPELARAGGRASIRWADQLPSQREDCTLIGVPTVESFLADGEARQRRRSDAAGSRERASVAAWIGLYSRPGRGPFSVGDRPFELPIMAGGTEETIGWWLWLLTMGGALALHTRRVSEILDDPVSGLPGRTALQAALGRAVDAYSKGSGSLSVLLMNPDDFPVNERFGREAGDRAIHEIASCFQEAHRTSDLVARYGGAIFGSILFDTDATGAVRVAEKVLAHLQRSALLDGTVRLSFSIGLVALESNEPSVEALELLRRAEQALSAAKQAGGGRFVAWSPGTPFEPAGTLGTLSGIFTGNTNKDYRNMLLLSEILSLVAASTDFTGLANQVVEKLYDTLKPDRVSLFGWLDGESPELIASLVREIRDDGVENRGGIVKLDPAPRRLLEEVRRTGQVVESELPARAPGARESRSYAVPLVVGGESLGCLFLAGRSEFLALDSTDLIFLRTLAAQLGVALDRARLGEQVDHWEARERQRLQSELDELRQALRHTKLIYRSPKMEAVLATVGQVAPTDATVMITGESGTGKELIARTLHRLSPRSARPLVVVDCGAIPPTLIESELFGHEKGAYTGAMQRRIGRLEEADGGTVLLDEIGELPLELQSKLLRFVQERELTPVGGSRARSVDVRVIAATNRNLVLEIQAGRFRQDLYYRLNVVRLDVPPLRERPEDILFLANHFLQSYSMLYQRGVRRLTPEAEHRLERYPCPGNVRELENMIMQAVILSQGPDLGPADLGLVSEPGVTATVKAVAAPWPVRQVPPAAMFESPEPPRDPLPTSHPQPDSGGLSYSLETLIEELRRALVRQVSAATGEGRRLPVPLGKWLGDDLILAADGCAEGVAIRAAALMGIAETTFRRRLQRATSRARTGLEPRPGTWQEVRQLLAQMVRANELNGEDLLHRTQEILLAELATLAGEDVKIAAALLGVTVPTFRRRFARWSATKIFHGEAEP